VVAFRPGPPPPPPLADAFNNYRRAAAR
jgi:hypothetical protein